MSNIPHSAVLSAIPIVQNSYNKFGEKLTNRVCVFRITSVDFLDPTADEADEEKGDDEVQEELSKIFSDDSRPTYEEVMETLTKDNTEEKKEVTSPTTEQPQEEEEDYDDDGDYEPSDCPLPAMNEEQAFHYRMTILNMLKEMIMDPKIMDDKKKHDSLLDHFM